MGMPTMPELIIVLSIIVIIYFLSTSSSRSKKTKEHNSKDDIANKLEQDMQSILDQNTNREIIVNKLKKLLLPKGYKVTIEEEYLIEFKAKGKRGYYVDLERYANNSTTQTPHQNPMLPIFESIVGMFSKIAKSDGTVSQEEADIIQTSIDDFMKILGTEYNYNHSELSTFRVQLIQVYKDAKSNNVPISTYAQKSNHMDIDFKSRIVQQLIVIATIDGYTKLKESLVYEAGTNLGLTHIQIKNHIEDIVGSKQNFSSNKDFNPYQVLQCKVTDTDVIIKKQYRILIKKYHPDFIQSKGLDEAFIEFAKQKLQEINRAYEIIKKERGL